MTEQPRDWDRELANIDKAIAKQQPAASGPAQTGSTPPPVHRRFVALTWFWTGLALLLAVALLLWPYDRNCGIRLVFFLGAGGLALLAGVFGALNSWAHHRGLAHLLSLLVIVWAGVMVVREILPRTGYTKEHRDWTCPPPPPVPNPAPPAQPSGQPGT
jgi:Na+-translocating ferredoxin:NAD+ oxidoreductase RnfD subunit